MPENEPPTPPSTEAPKAPTQAVKDDDSAFAEWYNSVEKRFQDLGDFIRSGKAGHSEPSATQAPAETSQRQSTPDETPDGSTHTHARDTKPPRPNHFWFRRLGE